MMLRSLDRLLVLTLAAGVIAVAAPPQATAQEGGTLRGSVHASGTGRPLEGAQVTVAGTSLGTLSNASGDFLLLNVPAGEQEVVVQFIGYSTTRRTVDVRPNEVTVLDLTVSESAISLDELVVTGTPGATEKRKLGNTLSSIDAGRIMETQPVQSFDELLSGRASGVSVLPTSGSVGTGSRIQVRGLVSVSQVNTPLIYVDGVRMDNSKGGELSLGGQGISRLQDIQASEIERVEVIKGAAATTLYGTEASAGVIQIFTKRGSEGDPRWTFQVEQGAERIPNVLEGDLYSEFVGPGGVRARDASDVIQTGHNQKYQLSVQGGNEGLLYYLSGNVSRAEGSITPDLNHQTQVAGRANITAIPSDDLSLNFNAGYVRSDLQIPDGDNAIEGYLTNIFLAVPYTATEERPWGESFTSIEAVRQIENLQRVHHFTGGITAEYQPRANLMNALTLGLDLVDSESTKLFPFGYIGSFYGAGRRDNWARTNYNFTVDYRTVLSQRLGESTTLESAFGAQGNWANDTRVFATGQQFPAPGVSTVGAAAQTRGDEFRIEEITAGVYLQETLGLADKLFLTGGLRLDGNSAFGQEFNTQLYPKASVAYNISDEGFWPSDFWPTMKLRAAWGTSGLAPAQFAADRTYEAVSALEGQPAVTPGNLGDPELAPEKSTEFELGFDGGFVGDRFGVSSTFFHQTTTDALIPAQFPPSGGFLNPQLKNIGTIRNVGIETSLDALWVTKRNLSFSTGLQFTWQDNEVTDMGGSGPILRHVVDQQRVVEGFPVDGVWGKTLLGWDPASRTHIVSDTLEFQGQASPKWYGSLSTTLTLWNDLTLSGLTDFAGGFYRNNATRMFRIQFRTGDEYLSTLERPDGTTTAASDSLLNLVSSMGISTYVEPGDFIKLRELALAYTLPEAWLQSFGVDRATVRLAGRNLLTFTDYTGSDPEVSWDGRDGFNTGAEFFTVPPPRRISLAIRTTF